MKQRTVFKRLTALLLCLLMILPTLFLALPASAKGVTSNRRSQIIVSLGDSYASGEGIEPFYGQDEYISSRVHNPDWLAHRSKKAWSGMLTLPAVRGQMKDHRDTNWYFVASSGATTEHIKRTGKQVVNGKTGEHEGEQRKDYDRDGEKGYEFLPGQLDVFYNTPGLDRNEVDYVTISIGGNDVGFGEVLKKAHHTFLSTAMYDYINEKLAHFYDKGGVRDNLRAAYKRIADAAPNATILVVGYPELLSHEGGGVFFDTNESLYIDTAVQLLNARIHLLVSECKKDGMNIEFVDVTKAFDGHQAFTKDPYINPIYYYKNSQDLMSYNLFAGEVVSSYSMHPNEKGAQAYAACVQEVIDRLEGEKGESEPERETSDERNVVLVLDTSGSMAGQPLRETKTAASEFIETVLREDASIGIVHYDSYAEMSADFSRDEAYLKSVVDGLYDGDMTNTEAGLLLAEQMLQGTTARKKIIVLMSDGLANEGKTDEDLTEYAETLKAEGIYIYTLGFFQDLYGSDKTYAQRSMGEIASPGCHYEVDSAENLRFFFGDIADQINGQNYVYIRIACPVDVEVSYNGETLSSVTGCTRTDFGSLTFEEGEDYWSYGDNRTKILRLREGADYQIDIRGNGEGTMTYTAGFMDENGEYTDMREITDVPITEQTVIQGNAERNDATRLSVDKDGDGRIDQTYEEGGPPKKGKDLWFLLWIGLGVLLIGGAIAVLVRVRKVKARAWAPAYAAPTTAYAAPTPAYAAPPPAPVAPTPAPTAPTPAPTPASNAWKRAPSAFSPAPSTLTPAASEPAAPEESGDKGFCTYCGAPVDRSLPFCSNCGRKL